jgi:hypothetical protein
MMHERDWRKDWGKRVRELEAQTAAMREVLQEFVNAPVEFYDDHLGWSFVEIQVSETTLEEAKKLLKGAGENA